MLLDGRRVVSCLMLAVAAEGAAVTTIEGVALENELRPIQQAFVRLDGLQCRVLHSGADLLGSRMLAEHAAGWPSRL